MFLCSCFAGGLAWGDLHGARWLLDGAWSPSKYGDFWVGSHLLIFPGVRSSVMVQSSGVEPPASGFWSPFYSSFKTFLSTQHRRQKPQVNGKTTLYSQEHLKRFTEFYKEKRRERREGEVIRRRKGRVKRENSNQAIYQILKRKWILKIRHLTV